MVSTVTAGGGMQSGVTVFSYATAASLIMTFGAQEVGGTVSTVVRADPNKWLWNYVYP